MNMSTAELWHTSCLRRPSEGAGLGPRRPWIFARAEVIEGLDAVIKIDRSASIAAGGIYAGADTDSSGDALSLRFDSPPR